MIHRPVIGIREKDQKMTGVAKRSKKPGSVQYCTSPASVWCQSAKVTLLTFSSGLRDKQATRGSNRQNHWTFSRPWTPESLIQEITHTHPMAHYRGSWSPLQNSLCWVQTQAPLCNCRALLKKKKVRKNMSCCSDRDEFLVAKKQTL